MEVNKRENLGRRIWPRLRDEKTEWRELKCCAKKIKAWERGGLHYWSCKAGILLWREREKKDVTNCDNKFQKW